ncbi:MAG: DEAD/DEAH box helicase family protein [Nitrospira sp.]|nr:DEAD/DEAH box helicase family protein [Nitrospira sp.]
MNRHVNAIAGRLSLRLPQRQSLEILDRVTEIVPPKKNADLASALAAIKSEFPTVTDFEREFPSLCFALATGVGKTRLMGAFISYLHLAHGINNFFVLAPNLTIYNKLITDFTPNTSKYVFKGIAEFATEPPELITGDDYEAKARSLFDVFTRCKVNVFNISKINTEVRGNKAPRIKRLSEYIGQSYFEYLAGLEALVLIMDESHRYRASAGIRAINELRPILGLELTATPFIGTTIQNRQYFKNVIYNFPLGRAMEDGFVKEPAVVTRKNFNPYGMSPKDIDHLKLEDGVHLHEQTKVLLETYAREHGQAIVKPFVLVVAQDTAHAAELLKRIQSDDFFEGRYKDKVIQVDSSTKEEDFVDRLLKVEHRDEATEIVIHVNMLQEGWDVTNLYTIIPLRAASAPRLIEQTIGRGLRLPYGKRTGVTVVDRLNVIAHDHFQEIIDEANKPDSPFRIQHVALTPDELSRKTVTVVSQPQLLNRLGLQPAHPSPNTIVASTDSPPVFTTPEEQKAAQIAYNVIRKLETEPQKLPNVMFLLKPEIQAEIVKEVEAQYRPAQLELEGVKPSLDFRVIVSETSQVITQQVIDIPRILVIPKSEVHAGFKPFTVDLGALNYPAPSDELWIKHLRTNQLEVVALGKTGLDESRMEDYVVAGLIDFDDVAYDEHAELLYDLAGQVVHHFRGYLSEIDTKKVLRLYQRDIARFVHAQMEQHYWEDPVEYEFKVSKGTETKLKESAYTRLSREEDLDFRQPPPDVNNIGKYLFRGFSRCLYPVQKFQSDSERRFSVILDRDTLKWFKPAKGQFQIFYKLGADQPEYVPDFVAETSDSIFMLEVKSRADLTDTLVQEKKKAAMTWCSHATTFSTSNGGKPWKYVLIPHDVIAENMTLAGLVSQFAVGAS